MRNVPSDTEQTAEQPETADPVKSIDIKRLIEKYRIDRTESDSDDTIQLAVAFDNNYAKYFAAVFRSIADNADPSSRYVMNVLKTDVSEDNIARLSKMQTENVSLRFFDISDFVREFKKNVDMSTRSYWRIETYYKCFIPILMHDFKRVLFFDVDVIFCGDPKLLMSEEYDGMQIIGVLDAAAPLMNTIHKERGEMLRKQGIADPAKYFNGGMILFNNESIDPEQYCSEIVSILQNNALMFQDQDLLNIVFQDSVKLVSCRYDFQRIPGTNYQNDLPDSDYKTDYISSKKDPIMIHYIGREKPWSNRYSSRAEIFWSYLEKTEYLQDVLDTDYSAGLGFMKRTVRKMKIWFTKHISEESWLFNFVENIYN